MGLKISNFVLMVFTVFIFMSSSAAAKADGVMGGSWQSWNSSILSSPGTAAYWNNQDPGDGNNANIGFCLTGGGNCSIPNPPGNLPFLSSDGTSGTAASDVSFTNNGGSTAAKMLVSITSQSPNDTFGWYTVVGGTPQKHPLFNGTQTGATDVFTPTAANYGFYIDSALVGTFFTQTAYDSTADNFQAFSLFQNGAGNYYLGAEDGGATRDRDYNDMVIQLTAIPEPSSAALLGGSLALIGAFLRRRARSQQSR